MNRQFINSLIFSLDDSCLFGDVKSVQELTDILILDGRGLLDVCGRKGNSLDVITFKDQFILLFRRVDDFDSFLHANTTDVFLSQEVTDFDERVVLRDDAVDGEMGMYCTHLVLESLGDT